MGAAALGRRFGGALVSFLLVSTSTAPIAFAETGELEAGQPLPENWHVVADTPERRRAMNLELSGGVLAADFFEWYDNREGNLYQMADDVYLTSARGDDAWSTALQPEDPRIMGTLTGFSGDVLLSNISPEAIKPSNKFRVSWPGGSRDFAAAFEGVLLGRGGQLIARAVGTNQIDAMLVEDVRTGEVLTTFESYRRLAMDGWGLWTISKDGRTVTGTDLSGREAQRTVATGVSCEPLQFRVVDRWALLTCVWGGGTHVVDLLGVLPPWRLPASHGITLGNGFVAWVALEPTSEPGVNRAKVVVADLAPSHAMRSYGPAHGIYFPPHPDVSADEGGLPLLAYLDADRQPRVVELGWLERAPLTRPDTTPPQLVSRPGTSRLAATTTVGFSWTFHDPDSPLEPASGLLSYDVRYRQAPTFGEAYGEWVHATSLQDTSATSASMSLRAGVDTCFQARARDRAGNVSSWSKEYCSAAATPISTAPTHGFFLNDGWDAVADRVFEFGKAADLVLVGDWEGDGVDTLALRSDNTVQLNSGHDSTVDRVFTYGRAGDSVLVGDWDGDGVDTLAVRRGNTYYLKNSISGGAADHVLAYGRAADEVLVGDWDGDGIDTLAVRRENIYYVKNVISGGEADHVVPYGRAADITLVGDWDGDGRDSFAVRRNSVYHVKNAIAGGQADVVVTYGRASDVVLVGDWNGDGADTLGVRRLP